MPEDSKSKENEVKVEYKPGDGLFLSGGGVEKGFKELNALGLTQQQLENIGFTYDSGAKTLKIPPKRDENPLGVYTLKDGELAIDFPDKQTHEAFAKSFGLQSEAKASDLPTPKPPKGKEKSIYFPEDFILAQRGRKPVSATYYADKAEKRRNDEPKILEKIEEILKEKSKYSKDKIKTYKKQIQEEMKNRLEKGRANDDEHAFNSIAEKIADKHLHPYIEKAKAIGSKILRKVGLDSITHGREKKEKAERNLKPKGGGATR